MKVLKNSKTCKAVLLSSDSCTELYIFCPISFLCLGGEGLLKSPAPPRMKVPGSLFQLSLGSLASPSWRPQLNSVQRAVGVVSSMHGGTVSTEAGQDDVHGQLREGPREVHKVCVER